jgi:hypothetical protein
MMRRWLGLALIAGCPAWAADKLTLEERVEIIRGLTAEYASVKQTIPRSKKPLPFKADGTWDKSRWQDAMQEMGPAARSGDLVQITKIKLEKDKILFEINGGVKSGRKWTDRIEVGMGQRTTPIGMPGQPTLGTNLALEFDKPLSELSSASVKQILSPILDFEKRTATDLYMDKLPEEIREAIEEKRPAEGMDRDQVLLALGRPRLKTRETKDGLETEEWIYGLAPGKITFVVFHGAKVAEIKEAYAGLGLEAAPPLVPQ